MRVFMLTIGIMLMGVMNYAQEVIPSRWLEVSDIQTCNLLFPATITSVDRGSEKIVIQKSINTVLRVKADRAFSDTTNLTIITSDGKLYSFLVHYNRYPTKLNISLGSVPVNQKDTGITEVINKVILQRDNLFGIRAREGRIVFSMIGVYSTGDQIICKLRLENRSSLSYAIGGLHIYSRDAVKGRRRTTQDVDVVPIFTQIKENIVKERGKQNFVVVLPKPSLIQAKKLIIEMLEKDGERNISISVQNRNIFTAPTIF